jgi:hypothetical protein
VVVALPNMKVPSPEILPPTKRLPDMDMEVEEAAPMIVVVKVVLPADRDPREVPPWTVRPVVVALPAVRLPKAERLVTLIAPKLAPPVTEREVEVPAVKTNEFNWVPPVTESPPLEVALAKVEAPEERDPREVPPWTVRPVVVALAKVVLPVTVSSPLWKVPPWTMRPVPPTTLGVHV